MIDLATNLKIQLLFLPSYSPNLNYIERLCKFIKKQVLYGRHYATLDQFRNTIDAGLDKIPTEHQDKLQTLMTHNFQTFDPASFLTA